MRRVVPALIAVAGAALAGAGIWFSTDRRPAAFGWTAYSPLTGGTYVPTAGPSGWAIAAIVVGCLMVGAALAVLALGARRG